MSTPQATRGQRGGSSNRGARGALYQPSRGRGSNRANSTSRGRGRGRGGSNVDGNGNSIAGTSTGAEGLVQKLRENRNNGADSGSDTRGRGRGAVRATPFTPRARGRGRGFANNSKTFNTPREDTSTPSSRANSPPSADKRNLMNAKYAEFQTLKPAREKERAKAIRDGFLADPDKKTSLDKAITPVGTCTDMCPRFERVERIVQNMVDRAEKEHDEEDGKDYPDEDRMVKRFRRSAAGYDEQLPSDIRTPETLKRTLDYLFNQVIGGADRLATVQKFVWDRTRGIRNDFSIQQVTRVEDVKLAVECYERIARFHILSLHQLSNPDNLQEGEHFDSFQEREQLNNTLLSLVYYYDDHRDRVDFPNEAEFRSYMVIFEIASRKADIEDRLQSWPKEILDDERLKTAMKLYAAAGSTTQPQGPLNPLDTAAVAQANGGTFWDVLASKSVPYIMACLTELYFYEVRFSSLDGLWRACKAQSQIQQSRFRDWTVAEVMALLGFDTEEQTMEFCAAFDLSFSSNESGEPYLDPMANSATFLDKSSTPTQQVFSYKYVEKKRYRRTLTAVINGMNVADAVRSGSTESNESEDDQLHPDYEAESDDESMFVPENEPATGTLGSSTFGSSLDPTASSFTPTFGKNTTSSPFFRPATESSFGNPAGAGSFGSTANPGNDQPTQPRTESTFGNASIAGGFGSSTTSSTIGKPVESSGTDSNSKKPLFGSTLTFGNTTTQEPNPAAASSPFGAFGASSAPSVPTTATSGGFGLPTAPSAPTFGQFNPAAKPSQSAAPLFGSNPGSANIPPPSATSESTFKSVFGQPPSQASVPPASAPSQADKSSTNQFSFGGPQSTPPAQSNEITSKPSFFAPSTTSTTFTSQPHSTSSSATEAPSPLFSSAAQVPPTGPSAVGQAPFKPFVTSTELSSETAAIGKTPFKPFLDTKTNLQPSVETTSPAPTEKGPGFSKQSSAKPFSQPPSTSSKPQRSTTPPGSPRQPPAKAVPTQEERHRLAAIVARIGFTQKNGLLNSFIQFALRELLSTVWEQHHRELREAAITSVRERILARKFGLLWRQRAWNNSLNRRAKNRRQMFAETIRAEQARKLRSEEELEEILKATKESQRIQKEVEEAIRAKEQRLSAMSNGAGIVKVAGQKRKSFSGQDMRASTMSSSNGSSSTPGHKRSKTMSTSERSISPPLRASISRPLPHVSIFSRTSTFGRSTSNSDLRKSVAQKLDNTRTDYFRLKAMGIDPDTPIVPDTKKSLALRKQREAEERAASINRANRRARTSSSSQTPPPSMPPPPAPQSRTPEVQHTPSKTTTPALAPVEDDFLKQIREAREAMAEETEWLKQQTGTLEQEIEQEEEFRRSQSSRAASPSSSSGLAKANGYEYLPAEGKPGTRLSRTELRIRQTGAHGLATKPLRSRSEYVPVAMSKRSALKYSHGTNASPGRKRSRNDVEPSDETETAHQAALHALKRPRAANHSQQAVHQKPKPRPAARNGASNPYQLLQSIDPDDEEADDVDDEHDTEELYDDEEEPGQPGAYPSYYQANGSYAEDEEEASDLEDEDEDDHQTRRGPVDEEYQYEDEEDEDEEEEYEYPVLPDLQGQGGYEDEDAATPASHLQISRAASSAPGGSVEEAFVIDDSD
ncbi:actin cytoskeleton and mitosis protein [Cladophialophora chaetospira]|uniref:Actin cytoskeleton and mitosis protein n=1 Tax=Cladophialophora chaetospira TaxID=386627 RepID=A0AA39CCZ9_9EURO|nr:actin cytoskeleton and mitosis protein [Cladophialophora chaetospira]